jgi:peroxin-6
VTDVSPANPILMSPSLLRSLFAQPIQSTEVTLQPTTFGARRPTLPVAKTMTIARISTTEGSDKRYERSWVQGLRRYFERKSAESRLGLGQEGEEGMMVKRGDIIAIPIWKGKPIGDDEATAAEDDEDVDSDPDTDDAALKDRCPTAIAYFMIASLSYDPLVALEEDFRSSTSSKARAGELGCWADVGEEGTTQLVLVGTERARISGRAGDRSWHKLRKTHGYLDIVFH